MIFVKPSFEYNSMPRKCDLKRIERIGRTCYKSEAKITKKSYEKFVQKLVDNKHESVLEHSMISVKFITNRGVSHELVRHRLASISQESTRYCRYNDHMVFVIPDWCTDIVEGDYNSIEDFAHFKNMNEMMFAAECKKIEDLYSTFLKAGWKPEQAREILPNCLKTEIHMTANIREWRHIFQMRCSKNAHPNMRQIMRPLLDDIKTRIPIVFDDITY